MNRYSKICLGASLGAIIRGFRFGLKEFYRTCRTSLDVTTPFEKHDSRILWSLPETTLETLLDGRTAEIKLRVMKYEDGMQPVHDAMALLSILVAENPNAILEIGTYMGHTTRAMAENVESATIHTIDLPPLSPGPPNAQRSLVKDDLHLIAKRVVGREFENRTLAARIVQHYADTAEFDFASIGVIDYFFIDGSHTYEYCRNDSGKCFQISHPGAIFFWHDCDASHPGVVRFLTEWRAGGKDIRRIAGTSLAFWKRNG